MAILSELHTEGRRFIYEAVKESIPEWLQNQKEFRQVSQYLEADQVRELRANATNSKGPGFFDRVRSPGRAQQVEAGCHCVLV